SDLPSPDAAARSIGGPPGYGRPRTLATLSYASPAASSTVEPRSVTRAAPSSTRSNCVCPPETNSARLGCGNGPCCKADTAPWPSRCFTPYSGTSHAAAYAFAAATPTSNEPANPGPAVTAIASTSANRSSAVSKARVTVGTMASRWARLATSGTTPPNRACCSTLEATSSANNVTVPSSWTATNPIPVSSQDVSTPITIRRVTVRTSRPSSPVARAYAWCRHHYPRIRSNHGAYRPERIRAVRTTPGRSRCPYGLPAQQAPATRRPWPATPAATQRRCRCPGR